MGFTDTLERPILTDWHNLPREMNLDLPPNLLGPKQVSTPKDNPNSAEKFLMDLDFLGKHPFDVPSLPVPDYDKRISDVFGKGTEPVTDQPLSTKPAGLEAETCALQASHRRYVYKSHNRSAFSSFKRIFKHPAGKHFAGHYSDPTEDYLRTTIQRRKEHYKKPILQKLAPELSNSATSKSQTTETVSQKVGNVLFSAGEVMKSKVGRVALFGLVIAGGATVGYNAAKMGPEKSVTPVATRAVTLEHIATPKVLANTIQSPSVEAAPQHLQVESSPQEKTIVITVNITKPGQTLWGQTKEQLAPLVAPNELDAKVAQAIKDIAQNYHMSANRVFVSNSFSTIVS